MEKAFHTLNWSISDHIGTLVLDQPPSNTMTIPFFHEILAIKDIIANTLELKAIVITGRGRHFSSGVAVDELLGEITRHASISGKGTHETAYAFLQSNYAAFRFFEEAPIPVVSAIRGVCLGSALELALFSHFRFCGEDAVFGLPEANFNLMPGIGGIKRFAALAGNAKGIEYILKGRTFDAETALGLGLVDAIWPKREVHERAEAFLQRIPENYNQAMKKVYLKRFISVS